MTSSRFRAGWALLGGTFDPIHNGHLALARAAWDALPVNEVRFVPAGNPWQKENVTAGSIRLELIERAIQYEPHLGVDRMELVRQGATYTIDTVKALRARVGPRFPLVWVLGADQWAGLGSWKDYLSLIDFVHFAVVKREGEPSPKSVPHAFAEGRWVEPDRLATQGAGLITEISMAPHRASSTEVRRLVNAQDWATLDDLLPYGVAPLIQAHQLYLSRS